MAGRHQLDEFVRTHRDPASLPTGRFEDADKRKVRCVECGRDGYGPVRFDPDRTYPGRDVSIHRILLAFVGDDLVKVEGPDRAPEPPTPMPWWVQFSKWQIACLMEHTWPCSCGLRFRDYATLWRHIGAPRPEGWGRQTAHEFALECEVA